MPVVQLPPSRLFERPDSAASKLDKYWSSCWGRHEEVLQQADTETAAAAALVKLMNREPGAAPVQGSSAEDVNLAMLYGALTADKALANRCIGYMSQNNRDGHQFTASQVRVLAHTHYPQLLPPVRPALLALAKELIQWEAPGADTLVLSLVRQVATGDLTEANVWLACNLLHTLKGAAAWMFRSASLTQAVLFKYLRLLPDAARGTKSGEVALSQHAIALCTRILTERWEIAASMGRDLARALQDVSQIAEFKALWKELLSGRPPGSGAGPPATICGADDVLAKLLSTRTPTTVLQAGLTQDMEKEMYFMLTQVRMGNQKRYQQWFMARHLSLPDSETVVPDLVRYICGCYHPPNHILSSEIIPRWAVLGWLMQCARSQPQVANTRLAVLYDLLLFQPQTDSIMNIEPAMLLMVHSIPRYPSMTNTLLEFLIMAKDHYNPARRALTHRSFEKGISALVQRGVVRSLDPIIKAEQLSPALRDHMARTFMRLSSGNSGDGKRSAPDSNNFASPVTKKFATPESKDGSMRSPRTLSGSGSLPSFNPEGSQRRSLDGTAASHGDDPGTPTSRGGLASTSSAGEPPDSPRHRATESAGEACGASERRTPAQSEDEGEAEGAASSSSLANAVARMRSDIEAGTGAGNRTEICFASLASQLVDALVVEQRRSQGGRNQQAGAAAADAAVQSVVECAKLCQDAGLAVFDNLPQSNGRRQTGATDFQAVLAQCPRLASEQCLGGALIRAAASALATSQPSTPASSRRAAEMAVPRLFAALRASEAVPQTGACLLSHITATVSDSADSCTEGEEGVGRDGGAGGEVQPESLQELYMAYVGCVAPDTPGQVVAEDLRGCLQWGLAEGLGALLRLLSLEGVPLAAGNPPVVEIAASICTPEQVALLSASLSCGKARLCYGGGSAMEVVRHSYAWDGHAQGVVWQLLTAELPAKGLLAAEELVAQVLGDFARAAASAGSQSDDISSPDGDGLPEPGAEASLGVLSLLRLLPPKRGLVDQLLALPMSFGSLATAAFASWLAMQTGRGVEGTVGEEQLAGILAAAGAVALESVPRQQRDLTCLAEAWQVPFTTQGSREEARGAGDKEYGKSGHGTGGRDALKGGGSGVAPKWGANGTSSPSGAHTTGAGGGLWAKANEDLESSDESL